MYTFGVTITRLELLITGIIVIIGIFLFLYGINAIIMKRRIKRELIKAMQQLKENKREIEKGVKEKETVILNTDKELQEAKAEIERLRQKLAQNEEEAAKYKGQVEIIKEQLELFRNRQNET